MTQMETDPEVKFEVVYCLQKVKKRKKNLHL